MADGVVRGADVLVVGAGLSGLVAAAEAADAGRRVVVLDQEGPQSLGGQAWWSLGGLFLIDSPEQRRLRVHDSAELAAADWFGSAGFDRPEDHWPRLWAQAYLDFAAGEKRDWLHRQGVRFFPVVGWAERGGYEVGGHGNSVPRFHLVWGSGPGIVRPFADRVHAHVDAGRIRLLFRHRVTEIVVADGAVTGVRGQLLAPSSAERGAPTDREVVDDFDLDAAAVIVASGGIGANHDLVRRNWNRTFGEPPAAMLSGVPDSTDGALLAVAERAGGRVINPDRMWHYPEGIANHSPVWRQHGIRILSGPTPLWLDAQGHRLPAPLFPGFDALGALRHITATGHPWSWFVLDTATIDAEFALSGSEQNPDFTGKSIKKVLTERAGGKITPALRAFLDRGVDFVTASTVPELAGRMNALTATDPLGDGAPPHVDGAALHRDVVRRDGQITAGLGKDPQVVASAAARRYFGDRRMRVAPAHRMLDPKSGPLIAVRLHVITRKTLGGLETDLQGRVLRPDGTTVGGLFAAGEAAGFGGGGMHGYRSLEGTFLGGCLFSGRVAGRSAAQ